MKFFRNVFLALALIAGIGAVGMPAQAAQVLLNNTYSKLTAAVAPGDTSITITAGDGVKFASATGGNTIRATLVKISGFREIAWEIVDVTARATDTLTITRAREGTTALSFSVGDLIDVRFTAGLSVINKVTITEPATGATLTIANGKTLTASNTLTLAGTDSTTMTFPSTSATIARTDAGQTFVGAQTIPSIIGTDTTDASSSTTGAFKTAGGMGIAKKLFVGTDATIGDGTVSQTRLLVIKGGSDSGKGSQIQLYRGATLTGAIGHSAQWAGGTSSNTSIASNTGLGIDLFVNGSSTAGLSVDSAAHIKSTSTAPALTSCGTTPAITGSDTAGTVTMGTGSPTGCTITFATAYTSTAPHCVVTWQTNLASMQYTISTTAITLVQTATSSNKVNYVCFASS